MESSCPTSDAGEVSPCLADGALSVELDGEPALLSPGDAPLGPGVTIDAVNLPGSCRSFGFEKVRRRDRLPAWRRLCFFASLFVLSTRPCTFRPCRDPAGNRVMQSSRQRPMLDVKIVRWS